MRRPIARLVIWLLALALLLGPQVGCAPRAETGTKAGSTPRAAVAIELLVVDDPAMAEAIGRLRTEWKARSGAAVSIAEMTEAELIAAESLAPSVDAVIYPSRQLGLLAERDWIAPLPPEYAQNRELAWSDTFELLQVAETHWGQIAFAVPLGSPVLTCYYRPDLLERFHRSVPQTWSQYHELAEFFSHRDNLDDAAPPADAPWYGGAEPLAKGWAGRVLLARAAAYAKHRDHYSTLFNIDTMEPLVGGAAFVRALEELVADSRLGPPNRLELDPAAARREFLQGHCALALSWPGHASTNEPPPDGQDVAVGFSELPGSTQVYNFAAKGWENRLADESNRMPLLCVAGRLGSITQQAARPRQTFQLLAWLSGQNWGGKIGSVSSASPATTLYRRSQLRAPQPWVDAGTDAAAAQQYAHSVQDALSRRAYLFALRIPGQEKYTRALDTAVEQAVAGKESPADALKRAAVEWGQITEQLGLDAQRKAYRANLGLEP
jgi:multiple sugar transport system substrate-binding protein